MANALLVTQSTQTPAKLSQMPAVTSPLFCNKSVIKWTTLKEAYGANTPKLQTLSNARTTPIRCPHATKHSVNNVANRPMARTSPVLETMLTTHFLRALCGASKALITGQENEQFPMGEKAVRRSAIMAMFISPIVISFTLMHDLLNTLPTNIGAIIRHHWQQVSSTPPLSARDAYRQALREMAEEK